MNSYRSSRIDKSSDGENRLRLHTWRFIYTRFNGEPEGSVPRENLKMHLRHRIFTPDSLDAANNFIEKAIDEGILTVEENKDLVRLEDVPTDFGKYIYNIESQKEVAQARLSNWDKWGLHHWD